MEILIILFVAGLFTKSMCRDGIDAMAVKKGREGPLPSTERWQARHPTDKPASGIGPHRQRVWENAWATWADWSDKRLRRRRMWMDQHGADEDQAWLKRQEEKLARAEARRKRLAAKHGVDKATTAAAPATEPAAGDATPSERKPLELVRPSAAVIPFPTRPTSADTSKENSSMTATAEIKNLADAQNYTGRMVSYLDQVNGKAEVYKAEMDQLSKDLSAELKDAELASSSLAGHGVKGKATDQMTVANEQLNLMQQKAAEMAKAIAAFQEAATTAKASYNTAKGAFTAQAGISEHVTANKGAGTGVADKTDYYANA